jgi:CTP-dependent riboflavin kinase
VIQCIPAHNMIPAYTKVKFEIVHIISPTALKLLTYF